MTADEDSQETDETEAALGTFVENVAITIDQAIVQHFSQHLYSSPHKAVEELVVNGYDAGAGVVRCYLPGEFTNDAVVVWDDGHSMDREGLHHLWWVARSPKNAPGARTVSDRDVIGKFGIGKLASYALGSKVAHLAHRDGKYLAVEFNFGQLDIPEDGQPPVAPPSEEELTAPLHELSEAEAREWVERFFVTGKLSDPAQELFSKDEWTFAVVHNLRKLPTPLQGGVLRRVLGNGLPNRPNFKMFVDNIEAKQTATAKKAVLDLDPTDPRLRLQLLNDWVAASQPGGTVADIVYPAAEANPSGDTDDHENSAPEPLPGGDEPASEGPSEEPDPLTSAAIEDLAEEDEPAEGGSESEAKPADVPFAVDGLAVDETTGELTVAGIGPVRIELRVYADSLLSATSADHGRSYGVFVLVRGRLLNEDDFQHLLHEPSFGTLYRTQIVIWADGVDRALLADRERLSASRPETRALGVLERAAYRAARQLVDRQQQKDLLDKLTSSLLPMNRRELWHDPLAAYGVAKDDHHQHVTTPEGTEAIRRTSGGAGGPIATYDSSTGLFDINTDHPFRSSVDSRIGNGKKAAELRRILDVYAVAEILLEGHLIDTGIAPETATGIVEWRNDLFREVARRFDEAPHELQARVRAASFEGDKVFELALTDLFIDMGFVATHIAGSGKEDILVVAPTGLSHHKFTVDAKGSKNKVTNVAAHIAGVASHRNHAGASNAIIIARDFAGFSNGTEAAVLQECEAVPGVSVVTLDVMFALHDLMTMHYYPLRVVLDLLKPVKTPEQFLADLEEFTRPKPAFPFPDFLQEVWERQQTSSLGETLSYQSVRQSRPEWKAQLDASEMDRQMAMLERATGGLVEIDPGERTITLHQSPAIVLEAADATFHGEGFLHPVAEEPDSPHG